MKTIIEFENEGKASQLALAKKEDLSTIWRLFCEMQMDAFGHYQYTLVSGLDHVSFRKTKTHTFVKFHDIGSNGKWNDIIIKIKRNGG